MARECRKPPITMQQVEKMPALREATVEGEEELDARVFPKSFAAIVKSAKFIEEAAVEKREAERLKGVRQEKRDAEERHKEDERKKQEDFRKARAEEKKQLEEAKHAAHLAELGKTLEKAALHKKYVKNLHDQAQAEVRETEISKMEPSSFTVISQNIASSHRVERIADLLKRKQPDVLLLQEVTLTTEQIHAAVQALKYNCESNIDVENPNTPGTAIIWSESLPVPEVTSIVTCQLQTLKVGCQTFFNIYAPSGSENRRARALLFTRDMFHHLLRRDSYQF